MFIKNVKKCVEIKCLRTMLIQNLWFQKQIKQKIKLSAISWLKKIYKDHIPNEYRGLDRCIND